MPRLKKFVLLRIVIPFVRSLVTLPPLVLMALLWMGLAGAYVFMVIGSISMKRRVRKQGA